VALFFFLGCGRGGEQHQSRKKPEPQIGRRIYLLLLAISLLLIVPARPEEGSTHARASFRVEMPATYLIGIEFGSDVRKSRRQSVEVSTIPLTSVESYDTTVGGIGRGHAKAF
jgi:hypothetical protein